MVGPSLSDEERDQANLRLRVAFVLLVGVSGGLVALQADASPLQLAGAVAAGLVVGAVLLLFLIRIGRDLWPDVSGRRPR
ncbi:MAG: hypothetical protein ABEJ28_10400 [Salinigranum sp.]